MGRGTQISSKPSSVGASRRVVPDFNKVLNKTEELLKTTDDFKELAAMLRSLGVDGNKVALGMNRQEVDRITTLIVDDRFEDIRLDWKEGRKFSYDRFIKDFGLVGPGSSDPMNDFLNIYEEDQIDFMKNISYDELSTKIAKGEKFNPGYLKEVIGMGPSFGYSHLMMVKVDRETEDVAEKIFPNGVDLDKFRKVTGHDGYEEMARLKNKNKFRGRWDFWGNARSIWQKGDLKDINDLRASIEKDFELLN